MGVMSLGRDEGESIEGSMLIVVGPDLLRRPRNGTRLDAHARTNALIIALAFKLSLTWAGLAQIKLHCHVVQLGYLKESDYYPIIKIFR
jgi:hypothetical protein